MVTLTLPDELTTSFDGRLLTPGDDGYEQARRVHNGLIDRRPALIARCLTTADVVDTVGLACDRGLEVSVRGGGHNVAGRAVADGGLMVDLALMRGIHVDPRRRTARAQGGATWGAFDRETALHGLATTGGMVSSTGIAGLTLGGGLGWLMGRYGLTLDNLISAEVVTAAGEVVTASEEDHPELFWALRGGGGNFGVVTSFEYRLHPLSSVLAGMVAYPLDAAKDVVGVYRDVSASAPDELTISCSFVPATDEAGPLVMLPYCHCGTEDDARADVAPLQTPGEPVAQESDRLSYPTVNTLSDQGWPRGAFNYWKSAFLTELSDGAVEVLEQAMHACPSPLSGILIEHPHGHAIDVDAAATAFPHREPGYSVLIVGQWTDQATTDTAIRWVRDTFDALQPFVSRRSYGNYLPGDDDDARDTYGPNRERLAQIKARYDPDNLFRHNLNITPATPSRAR